MEKHITIIGGDFIVDSEEDKGSTFGFILPIVLDEDKEEKYEETYIDC